MSEKPSVIALLTDFGASDAYVAAMKGVIYTIAPAARVVDITHTIEPQNVRQAAYVLLTTYRYFPAHTVFVAVVDPGVGTARRALAAKCAHGRFVGPDNGLFSYVFAENPPACAAAIENPAYVLSQRSHTFHGRDVFAPAGAHLARGVPVSELGPVVEPAVSLPLPRLEVTGGAVRGEVIHIDHFGNVITSIGRLDWQNPDALALTPRFGAAGLVTLPADARITAGPVTLHGIRPSYGHAGPGEALALVNSAGQLELAVNQGSAAEALGVGVGDAVRVEFQQ